ncbi:cytochrome b5 reductase 4 isoform X2 [Aethina tumida]|uniref:cytochrome b5 reductase 4 isoform X2 n=1 Tax=Aethina tumida TaxID=116153 RepID=UPI00096B1E82|nr:cytochrome b5 reductase 4 isoform X2 [Aethina tumida]
MPCNLSGLCCWKSKGSSRVGVKHDDKTNTAGNPRNKCALQPGHSLMDWIRLGNSGKDLTGVGAKAGRLSVTSKELATHDKETDCWIAIRGRVFNVTAYLPFHPGGVEELMKGAGKDATTLFDQVHPWVNYESILQKCYVGRLVSIDPSINKEELFMGKDSFIVPKSPTTQVKTPITPSKSPVVNSPSTIKSPDPKQYVETSVQTPEDESLPLPRFDWIQKMNSITIVFYTGAFSNPYVEISPPNQDNEININLCYKNTLFNNEIQFLHPVKFPCKTKVYFETGKVEMVFMKNNSDIWENYGLLRQKSTQIIQGSLRTNFVLVDKKQVNHNTYLLKLERADKYRCVVPIGKHVRVFALIQGSEISRSYTAVPDSLFNNFGPKNESTDSVCLMIKKYPDGSISPYVTSLEKNEVVCCSHPIGSFDLQKLEKLDKFILLAAGTGITPMLGLITFLLERRIKKCQSIVLLFFNRTEEDIPFKSQLDELAKIDSRLSLEHVLSEAKENWHGLRGRITKDLLTTSISKELEGTIYTKKDLFSCICGPNAFVDVSDSYLKELGFLNDQIHCFQG